MSCFLIYSHTYSLRTADLKANGAYVYQANLTISAVNCDKYIMALTYVVNMYIGNVDV